MSIELLIIELLNSDLEVINIFHGIFL